MGLEDIGFSSVMGRVTYELLKHFGRWENVPRPLQEAAWLLHMRLQETEAHLGYFRERLAEYTGGAAPPETGPAGPETGEF